MRICILSCFEDLILRDMGPSIRTFYLAKSLVELGHDVHIVIPGEKVEDEYVDKVLFHKINGFCPKPMLESLSRIFGALRFKSFWFYDFLFILRACYLILRSEIVQIEQPWAGGLLIPLVSKIFRKPLVINTHDAFQALRVKHTNIFRKILEIFLEKISYDFADLILTVSEKDRDFLISYGVKRNKIKVVPNGVDTNAFAPSFNSVHKARSEDYSTVVFVGNLEYVPNQEAVNTIASILVPKIRSKINSIRFLVVGRTPTNLKSSVRAQLAFTGVVKNVTNLLVSSDVAIAPLFQGSGTRLKILEYFACGLPVVSTSVGVEGLDVKNGTNVLIENDMNEFASKVTKILEDRTLSMRLGKAARELVLTKYDWSIIARRLDKIYRELLARRCADAEHRLE